MYNTLILYPSDTLITYKYLYNNINMTTYTIDMINIDRSKDFGRIKFHNKGSINITFILLKKVIANLG